MSSGAVLVALSKRRPAIGAGLGTTEAECRATDPALVRRWRVGTARRLT
ncbi:MAG: hypothetical protein NW205_05290 [Hyphomicrobiaceae bacterium]|nr:hypothetical protein [Hyphomicrobiaceae bacterium]